MEKEEDKFIKGANTGYLLSKYGPDLLSMLLKQQNEGNEYLEGMQFDHKKHERELFLENLQRAKQ